MQPDVAGLCLQWQLSGARGKRTPGSRPPADPPWPGLKNCNSNNNPPPQTKQKLQTVKKKLWSTKESGCVLPNQLILNDTNLHLHNQNKTSKAKWNNNNKKDPTVPVLRDPVGGGGCSIQDQPCGDLCVTHSECCVCSLQERVLFSRQRVIHNIQSYQWQTLCGEVVDSYWRLLWGWSYCFSGSAPC